MLTCQKERFDLPSDVVYLNGAYMSPLMKSVEAIGHEMLSMKCRPFSIRPVDFFEPVEALKTEFAKLVGAREKDRIAIIPSASYGLANVARNLPVRAGQEIVVVEEQFPSNFYVWKRLADENQAILKIVGPYPGEGSRTQRWNRAILDAIGENTALVAIGNVHWADGTWFDLPAIRQRTFAADARLVIDGTQSVGALPIDVETLQPDALICAGYKWLMGPYGIGVGYYGPYFDEGIPVEENWINRLNSEDFRGLVQYQPEYKPLAGRYSVGEQSNFILIPMLKAAMEQLLSWEIGSIQEYCKALSAPALNRLQEMGAQVEPETDRCGHLIGIRLHDRFDPDLLQQELQLRKVYVSLRGNAIRVSPNVYNDAEDFDTLVRCFESARKKEFFQPAG